MNSEIDLYLAWNFENYITTGPCFFSIPTDLGNGKVVSLFCFFIYIYNFSVLTFCNLLNN